MHGVAIGDDNCKTNKMLVQKQKYSGGRRLYFTISGFQGNDDLVHK